MVTRTWDGSSGNYSSATDWSPTGVPASGDVAIINSGTVMIGSSDLAPNLTLNYGVNGTTPMLTLQGTVIPATDTLQLGPYNGFGIVGATANETVLASGNVTNNGAITVSGSVITLSISGTLTNNGTIALDPTAVINSAGGLPTNQLINNGILSTFRVGVFPAASYAPQSNLLVNVPVSGSGAVQIGLGTVLEFASSVGAGQTVSLRPLSTTYGTSQYDNTLQIDNLTSFAASIARFGGGEAVIATGPSYTSTQTTLSSSTTTLTFLQGAQTVASLTFQGRYSSAQFLLSTAAVANGQEQTTITFNANAAAPPAVANPAPTLPVYRFFSTQNGTQFLTASASEAATVGSTRPDLVAENAGFAAVNPATNDTHAVQIYRFFDQVDGTHFYTASAAERDQLIVNRSDLTYEPNSTVLEHATQQPGDVAVTRFFESTNGTHFYTANTSEVASIAATRPDLVNEGVAFYAPSS